MIFNIQHIISLWDRSLKVLSKCLCLIEWHGHLLSSVWTAKNYHSSMLSLRHSTEGPLGGAKSGASWYIRWIAEGLVVVYSSWLNAGLSGASMYTAGESLFHFLQHKQCPQWAQNPQAMPTVGTAPTTQILFSMTLPLLQSGVVINCTTCDYLCSGSIML